MGVGTKDAQRNGHRVVDVNVQFARSTGGSEGDHMHRRKHGIITK